MRSTVVWSESGSSILGEARVLGTRYWVPGSSDGADYLIARRISFIERHRNAFHLICIQIPNPS